MAQTLRSHEGPRVGTRQTTAGVYRGYPRGESSCRNLVQLLQITSCYFSSGAAAKMYYLWHLGCLVVSREYLVVPQVVGWGGYLIVPRRYLVVPRGYLVVSRKYLVVSRKYLVVSRGYLVVPWMYLVVSRGYLVVPRKYLVVSRGYLIVPMGDLVVPGGYPVLHIIILGSTQLYMG